MRRYVSLVAMLLAMAPVAPLRAQTEQETSAWELYERGRDAEKAGHMSEAYLYYAQASAKEPRNKTYWQHTQAVQTRAAKEAQRQAESKIPAPADLDKELANPPGESHIELPSAEDLIAAREPLPPTELDADKSLHDVDFTGDFKKLFASVAKVYGLDCIFDTDYQPGTSFHFRLLGVDYRDAIHGLEAATGSFVVPITPKIFLVAKDTAQKRTEIEPTVTMSVNFPDVLTQQEFEQLVRAVAQTMAIEKFGMDPTTHTVIMRDRISKVVYARALFQQLMHQQQAQVMLDLRFIEVSRNDSITYGLNFPNIFSLQALTNYMNNLVTLPSGLQGFLSFGAGKTLIGLGIAGASLVAQLSNSNANLLLASQLRAVSGQKATLHIGEKYPILTGGYGAGTTTPTSGVSGLAVAPTFSFQDLGLTMTTTAIVHDSESVSLDMEAQYQVLTGQSINGLPVISSRAVKNITRLNFGEWAVIDGLLTTDEARTLSGLAGLNRIPFLGPLTNTHTKNDQRDQVLILLRPTLLALPPGEGAMRSFYTGSENRPLTPL